jgi:hypothetical protein
MLLYFLKDLAPCCGRARRASAAAALKQILVEGGAPVSRNLPYQIENALDA